VHRSAQGRSGPALEPIGVDEDELTVLARDALSMSQQDLGAGGRAVELYHLVQDATVRIMERPVGLLDRVLRAVIDTAAYRIDPWITALAWRRLQDSGAAGHPFHLGVYGWVDQPRPGTPGPTDGGLLHAPSEAQAVTASILRDKAIHDFETDRWDMDLESSTIRLADRIAEEVRLGAHIAEVLGREIERIAGTRSLVQDLRDGFPMRTEHAGRRVCDGLAILAANPANLPLNATQIAALEPLRRALAKDFYAMKAFFADIKETGLIPDRGVKAWGSKMMLPTPAQEAKLAEYDAQILAAKKALTAKAKALQEQRWEWEEKLPGRHLKGEFAWQYQKPVSATAANGATLTIYNDEDVDSVFYLFGSVYSERKKGAGLIVASGENPDNETYTVRFKPGAGSWTSLGIDVHQDESLPGNRVARGADRVTLTEVEAETAEGPLEFVLAASHEFGEPIEQPAMAAIDGNPDTGWGASFGEARNPFLALRLKQKLITSAGTVITVKLKHDSAYRRATIGRFRLALSSAEYSAPESGESATKFRLPVKDENILTLSVATDRGVPPAVLRAIQVYEQERTEEQSEEIEKFFLYTQPSVQPALIELANLQAARNMLEASIPAVLRTERVRPRVTRILPRGNFLDKSGAIVEPAIPVAFGKINPEGRYATRLDLANWLVSKDNPLTPRVFVNRTWRQFFGTGLSKILEDLGSQGEMPSHPELLDWLAAEFRDKWDVNQVVRTIVTSHTYRQSSLSSPLVEQKDPYNRLLARQSRFRVDAEVVHDIALSVADLLKERFGGPSVKPYQPYGYYATLNFPKREYSASRGDDLYRRALYTHWQRTFLHPSLQAFDAPSREECTVNRTSSNTPLQSLVLLNDPIYVEAAEAFGRNIRTSGAKDLKSQIDWAFLKALNRPPDKQEEKIVTDLYKRTLKRQGEAVAMTTVARAILNLHETITRN
jgi:hypothetical protein